MPPPLPEIPHPVNPLTTDVRRQQRPKAVPPQPHRLVANVDTALKQQVLDVAQRQRKSDVRHHHEPEHLRRGVEVPERTGWLSGAGHAPALPPQCRHIAIRCTSFGRTDNTFPAYCGKVSACAFSRMILRTSASEHEPRLWKKSRGWAKPSPCGQSEPNRI